MIDDGRLPWVPLWPVKLLNALASMKPDQQIIYQIILWRIYEVEGPCPDSLDALAKRGGINKRRVTDALDPLFKTGQLLAVAGGIMNPFAAKVLAGRNALRWERASAGRIGGLRAAKNRKENQSPPPSKAAANSKHIDREVEESLFPNGNKAPASKAEPSAEADLFRRGREILGAEAGGLIKKVLKAKDGSVPLARAAIETAATKNDPREYIGGVIRAKSRDQDQTVDGRL
jgi:hypothetical protein